MSVIDMVAAWLQSAKAQVAPTGGRPEEQARESEAVLRQLRSELRLMRAWKAARRLDDDAGGEGAP